MNSETTSDVYRGMVYTLLLSDQHKVSTETCHCESSMATRARALFTGNRQSQNPAVSFND